jgi:hypothetical protein
MEAGNQVSLMRPVVRPEDGASGVSADSVGEAPLVSNLTGKICQLFFCKFKLHMRHRSFFILF